MALSKPVRLCVSISRGAAFSEQKTRLSAATWPGATWSRGIGTREYRGRCAILEWPSFFRDDWTVWKKLVSRYLSFIYELCQWLNGPQETPLNAPATMADFLSIVLGMSMHMLHTILHCGWHIANLWAALLRRAGNCAKVMSIRFNIKGVVNGLGALLNMVLKAWRAWKPRQKIHQMIRW